MYGIETIKAMNREAGRKARNLNREPLVFDGDCSKLRNMPYFGSYRATRKGWRKVNEYFVDSSGFGSDTEPAMTFNSFCKQAKKGYGYAILESGQFQVYIGEFKKYK